MSRPAFGVVASQERKKTHMSRPAFGVVEFQGRLAASLPEVCVCVCVLCVCVC